MFQPSTDSLVQWILRIVGGLACLVVVLLVVFLFVESLPALNHLGIRLLIDDGWFPEESASAGWFGLGPMIAGSLVVTFGAILIAAPLGFMSAVFCEFYAPPIIASGYRRLVELLAGIPSVVFGFWGLIVLTPLIAKIQAPGPSLLAGIIIVALMILPTILLVILESLAAVPAIHFRSAAALGVGRLSFVRHVAIPQIRSGIANGILLGAARAIGETMAVVMVCGNIVKLPSSLFDPVRTLTANIALEMGYALGDHRSSLFASGLILLLVVALFLGVAEMIRWICGGQPTHQVRGFGG